MARLSDPSEDPFVGSQVARYRLTRLLGKGGMGRVYLGTNPEIGSRVAIKILAEDCADSPELVERFFAEARAVNLIKHDNIINVLDLDRLPSGRPYIVMEYVDGKTLRDVADLGAAPLGGIVHATIEVLLALEAAHTAGVIHRDLKPDNVMITEAGRTKVLDFGIAKLVSPTGPRTQTGVALGTPQYMAPEQIRGEPVDARTDVYAVGVMLFELATGRRPFEGTTDYQLMDGHLHGQPPKARELRAEIPASLEAVIDHALAKLPANRFQSARAMAHALRHAAGEVRADQWQPLASLFAMPAAAVSHDRLPIVTDSGETHREGRGAPGTTPTISQRGSAPRADEPAPTRDARSGARAPQPTRDVRSGTPELPRDGASGSPPPAREVRSGLPEPMRAGAPGSSPPARDGRSGSPEALHDAAPGSSPPAPSTAGRKLVLAAAGVSVLAIGIAVAVRMARSPADAPTTAPVVATGPVAVAAIDAAAATTPELAAAPIDARDVAAGLADARANAATPIDARDVATGPVDARVNAAAPPDARATTARIDAGVTPRTDAAGARPDAAITALAKPGKPEVMTARPGEPPMRVDTRGTRSQQFPDQRLTGAARRTFDPGAWAPFALKLATDLEPDAVLLEISAWLTDVSEDSATVSASYEFRSAAAAADPSRIACIMISVNGSDIDIAKIDGCKGTGTVPPKCRVTEVYPGTINLHLDTRAVHLVYERNVWHVTQFSKRPSSDTDGLLAQQLASDQCR